MRVPTPVDTYVEPVVTASPRNGVPGSQLLRLCVGGSPPLCQYSMLCVHYPGGRISFRDRGGRALCVGLYMSISTPG